METSGNFNRITHLFHLFKSEEPVSARTASTHPTMSDTSQQDGNRQGQLLRIRKELGSLFNDLAAADPEADATPRSGKRSADSESPLPSPPRPQGARPTSAARMKTETAAPRQEMRRTEVATESHSEPASAPFPGMLSARLRSMPPTQEGPGEGKPSTAPTPSKATLDPSAVSRPRAESSRRAAETLRLTMGKPLPEEKKHDLMVAFHYEASTDKGTRKADSQSRTLVDDEGEAASGATGRSEKKLGLFGAPPRRDTGSQSHSADTGRRGQAPGDARGEQKPQGGTLGFLGLGDPTRPAPRDGDRRLPPPGQGGTDAPAEKMDGRPQPPRQGKGTPPTRRGEFASLNVDEKNKEQQTRGGGRVPQPGEGGKGTPPTRRGEFAPLNVDEKGGRKPEPHDGGRAPSPSPTAEEGRRTKPPTPHPDFTTQSVDEKGGRKPQPHEGGRTPQPHEGGRTPQPHDGGRTPQPHDGGRTPHPHDGGRTPQPHDGGRKPQPHDGGDPHVVEHDEPSHPHADNVRPRPQPHIDTPTIELSEDELWTPPEEEPRQAETGDLPRRPPVDTSGRSPLPGRASHAAGPGRAVPGRPAQQSNPPRDGETAGTGAPEKRASRPLPPNIDTIYPWSRDEHRDGGAHARPGPEGRNADGSPRQDAAARSHNAGSPRNDLTGERASGAAGLGTPSSERRGARPGDATGSKMAMPDAGTLGSLSGTPVSRRADAQPVAPSPSSAAMAQPEGGADPPARGREKAFSPPPSAAHARPAAPRRPEPAARQAEEIQSSRPEEGQQRSLIGMMQTGVHSGALGADLARRRDTPTGPAVKTEGTSRDTGNTRNRVNEVKDDDRRGGGSGGSGAGGSGSGGSGSGGGNAGGGARGGQWAALLDARQPLPPPVEMSRLNRIATPVTEAERTALAERVVMARMETQKPVIMVERAVADHASSVIGVILKKAYPDERQREKDASKLVALILRSHGFYTYEHCTRLIDLASDLAATTGRDDAETRRRIADGITYKDLGEVEYLVSKGTPRQRQVLTDYLAGQKMAQSGLLHDIGKIKIPKEILYKPGMLTPDEAKVMQMHPVYGAEILQSIPPLAHAAPAARHHHERYDGKGYPDRLAGEQIPFEARVISIVDAFDAMAADRPYRGGLPLEVCRNELLKGRGKQFDPQLVEAFMEVLDAKFVRGKMSMDDYRLGPGA